jgi:hypothetical protein
MPTKKKAKCTVEKLLDNFESLSYAEKGDFLRRIGVTGDSQISSLQQTYFSRFLSTEDTQHSPTPTYKFSESYEFYFWGMKAIYLYDHQETIKYLKALLALERITEAYQRDGAHRLTIEFPRNFLYENDDDARRQMLPLVYIDQDTPQEQKMDILTADQYFRNSFQSPAWLNFFAQLDRDMPEYESTFRVALPLVFAQGARKLVQEIAALRFFADQNGEIPTHIHDQLRQWQLFVVGRNGAGWRHRSPKTGDANILPRFVSAVDNCYELARHLKKTYIAHAGEDWRAIVKASSTYRNYVKKQGPQFVDEVIELMASRLENRVSRKYASRFEKITSPLAFACELAARELDYKRNDGKEFETLTLLAKYGEGGGQRKSSAKNTIH